MSELGWQPFPGAGAPVEVAAAAARGPLAGLGVGDAAFASPDTGWVFAGDGEAAQCRVLFTDDAGATWRTHLAWRGLLLGRLAAFGERQAALGLSVSQGDDINGYRPDPHPPGDPFVGPDAFLASTQDADVTWTLAPMPDRQASGFHFLAPRQAWVELRVSALVPAGDGSYVRREGGARCDLMRTQDGGISWQRIRGMNGAGTMTVRFQSEAEGLMVATGDGNRADRLYRTQDGGLSWEPVPLAPPPGLPASAVTLLDPVTGPRWRRPARAVGPVPLGLGAAAALGRQLRLPA